VGGSTAISILYPTGGPGEYKVVEVESDTQTAEAETEPAEQEEPQVEPLPVRLASADASAGEALSRQCAACHSFNEGGANGVGPNLWSTVGREVAALDGFSYSSALQEYGGEWSYERLDCFLENPQECVPGTNMGYAGIKDPGKRADMVAYLASLGDAPPLPEVEDAATQSAEATSTDDASDMDMGEAGQAAQTDTAAAGDAAEPSEQAGAEAGTTDMASADASAEQQSDADVSDSADQADADQPADQAGSDGGTKLASLFANADPAAGENSVQTCVACHSFNEGGPTKVGPNLYGIMGSQVASVDGYSYSNALTGLGGEWTYERMNEWLKAPMEYAPGTTMAYPGVKDDSTRADIIAYLASLGDAPPLPGAQTGSEDGDSADAGAASPDSGTMAASIQR